MVALADFLRAAAAREFKLGEWDCGLWLADWYVAKTGKPDPAAHLRGAIYRNEDIVMLCRANAKALGLARTSAPVAGDVGIVRIGDGARGGIFTGSRWAVLGEAGICASRHLRVIASWRVE